MKDRFCFRAGSLLLPNVPSVWMDVERREALAKRLHAKPENDDDKGLFPHEIEIKARYQKIMKASLDDLSPDEAHQVNILTKILNKYTEIRELLRELNKEPVGKEGAGDPELDVTSISDSPKYMYLGPDGRPLPVDRQTEVGRKPTQLGSWFPVERSAAAAAKTGTYSLFGQGGARIPPKNVIDRKNQAR